MKRITLLAAAVAMLAMTATVPAFAVDKSIDDLCTATHAGSGYQRAGGYCDQVASNKSIVATGSPRGCPACFHPVGDGAEFHCLPI